MASTLAAIHSTPVEDFYVVPSENLADGAVGFRILVNPLVWWMWVAGPVLVLGTVVSLWPERSRQRVPAPISRRGGHATHSRLGVGRYGDFDWRNPGYSECGGDALPLLQMALREESRRCLRQRCPCTRGCGEQSTAP